MAHTFRILKGGGEGVPGPVIHPHRVWNHELVDLDGPQPFPNFIVGSWA